MTLTETLEQLKDLGNDKMRLQNIKKGAGNNQYGVRLGDIKKLGKQIKINLELALALWDTKNIEARLLSTIIIKPNTLTLEQLDQMVRSITFVQVADWFNAYVVKPHPENERLREDWMKSEHPMAARAGWNLTSIRVAKNPAGLVLNALLNSIEKKMLLAHPLVQWTMNFTLAEIGIKHPDFRKRALSIGENLGVYRDFPVSKGCTSPFAPLWIAAMVNREK